MTAPMAKSRPDADARPLAPKAVAALRAALLEELAAHQGYVEEAETTVDALTGQTDNDSILEREMAEHAAVRGIEAVADIQEALRRIEAGTYGACERCGGTIALERLEAIPYTRHCVTCPAPPPRLVG
jgi:RNA polymerase-binding transcription factor DksA